MMAGLIGLSLTGNLFFASSWVIALQSIAVLLFLWARLTFGRRSYHVEAHPTAGGLVTNGPYRYIRHPIYSAICLFTWAGALAHWSWSSGLLAGLVFGSAIVRIYCEEVLVEARYPGYADYRATTWRLIPYLY